LQLYKENEKNGYKTYMNISANTPADICIMQPYRDLEWRKVAQNVKFRQALAYSINYEEIIDSVFLGFGEIPDELNACAEYNVAKANQLLDEIGLDKKDASGFRLRPDGVRMELYNDSGSSFPEHILVSELLVEYWQAIGLYTSLSSVNADLMYERLEKQDIQVMLTIGSWPLWFQPWWNGSSLWARQFQFFYNTSGTTGEEGPQIITDYFKLLSSVNQVPAEKAVSEVIPAIKKMHRENLFTIVIVSDIPKPIIVNAKIGNYTEDCLSSAIQFTAEQWYYKK
jgi:peptide/nickel transport system substrate-binding protein